MRTKQRAKGKWLKLRRAYFFIFIVLCLCASGSWFAGAEYQSLSADYSRYMVFAHEGMQDLRVAVTALRTLPQNPLDAHPVSQAQQAFASALTAFDEINTGLRSLPSVSTSVPVFGTRLSAALHLVSLAIGVSQGGIAGCTLLTILITKFHSPLNSAASGLTTADFARIDRNYSTMRAALQQAIDEANTLRPGDLQFDAQLAQAFATYKGELPTVETWLDAMNKLVPALPTLLGVGKPANYLVEVLDSSELRPAGGFIGNYGIATFAGGRLTTARITDVDLLDGAFKSSGRHIRYPPAYVWFSNYLASDSWSLRDSNLDADFPTAARYGELNYGREGGKIPVQGVIAITPALVQQLLAITGPIAVPEYSVTVTAQNLIAQIHFHQLGNAGEGSDLIPSPDGHSSERKRFTELLAEHFMARMRQLPASALPKILQVFIHAVHTKDVQVYLNDSGGENVLRLLHLDGTIAPAAADYLFIVDANVSPNKANSFIVSTLDDAVSIDAEGDVQHRATIRYAWTIAGQDYGHPLYRDYLRVYVPPGSRLQSQGGWQSLGTSEAFGHEVWAGFFTLVYGQTRAITLTWTVPGVARKDGGKWQYSYLMQRQAGKQETVDVRIALPSGGVLSDEWGGLVVGERRTAVLDCSLTQDLNVGMDYLP